MLPKDLRRVSRAGGGYQPKFADEADRELAARVIGIYQGHVDERRERLDDALEALEREADDHKLVRGFAHLLDREATFEVRSPLPPRRTRRAVFEAAEAIGVVTDPERDRAIQRAATDLGVDPEAIERSLHADRDRNEVLVALDADPSPSTLIDQYNLALAGSALFDATELRVHASDPRRLVSAAKWHGLLYEVVRTESGRELVVTGPTGLFGPTRRYGIRFARLLRTIAGTDRWELRATIDDRGTERELRLTQDDPISTPGGDDETFDSAVEAEFAARFSALDLDWKLVREPEPLATGTSVMIPDFAFDYCPPGTDPSGASTGSDPSFGAPSEFRVYFEIMGFWTPEYVEKKLGQLDDLEDVELLVAYDASLRADGEDGDLGAAIEARNGRAIPYEGRVRPKDVRDALREYERDLVAAAAAELPDDLVPDEDVVAIDDLAERRGVAEAALDSVSFPDHERIGRTLVRPAVLEALAEAIEPGMELSDAESVLDEYGLDDASAALSTLGYRVEWDGLSGGTIREK